MIYRPMPARSCPVCGTTVINRFLTLRDVPVNCSALWFSEERARAALRGNIELALCTQCGMIFNAAFDSTRVEYDLTYDNSLSYSATFQAFSRELANRLVDVYDLHGKDLMEVGCGKGDFLELLCAVGGNLGIGFDPSAQPRQEPGRFTIEARVFTAGESRKADFLLCRHVLEHINDPHNFLTAVWGCLAERQGAFYFEVPDARSVLDGPTLWDVIYPHCSYFTPPALRFLLESCGFEVARLDTTFGGQFLMAEGKAAAVSNSPEPDTKAVGSLSRLARRFSEKLQAEMFGWSRFIEYALVERRRIALWGAGAKAVTFLNVVPGANRIGAVIDINPRKHGSFVPCTAQPVLPPEALPGYHPDIIIVLNPLYEEEIRECARNFGQNPAIVLEPRLPLPPKEHPFALSA